jgi:AraC-like DNA-binding protein
MTFPAPAFHAPAKTLASMSWQLASDTPVLRHGLCNLAQPCLTHVQHTPRFHFHDATLLLIASGQLDLKAGNNRVSIASPSTLLLVDANTSADLIKTPGGTEERFRSVFMTLSAELLDAFHRSHPSGTTGNTRTHPYQQVMLDDELTSTFHHVVTSIDERRVSDMRLHYRLIDLLLLLAERGHHFQTVLQHSTAQRLRTLISATPDRHWTAREAGQMLAMSEATLRRRLTEESVRFEDVLIDTRMHHALMLLQTTSWHIPHIALACGYQSRARFSERFRARFGYLPSTVR